MLAQRDYAVSAKQTTARIEVIQMEGQIVNGPNGDFELAT